MEEGSLRCDANISVRPAGSETLGTKTELKNMNSFRFIERGIAAEIGSARSSCSRAGGRSQQETLHFDPGSGSLTSLRSKEYAHDYRYLPEPDLVPARAPPQAEIDRAREALPELPAARRDRYASELGLAPDDAAQLAFDAELGAFFERAADLAVEADNKAVANWVTGELVRVSREAGLEHPAATEAGPDAVAGLADLVASKTINRKTGRTILGRLVAEGGDPAAIVEAEGLGAVSADDGALEAAVERAIADQPDAAEKVRGGETKAIGALVGAVMRETQGRADGGEVTRLIREKLGI